MRVFCCLLFSLLFFNSKTLIASSTNQIFVDTLKPKSTLGYKTAELIDQHMLVVPGVGSSARDMLSEQSIKAYIMPPRNQSKWGKSYAFALTSCLEFYVNIDNNYKLNLSPSYISLSVEKQGGNGSIADAFRFLATAGTVSAAIMPYEAKVISSGVYATPSYKIKNYLHIIQSGERSKSKVFATKKAIMRGNPVIVEMQITQAFEDLKNKKTWNPSKGDTNPVGTQNLVVVGYDEDSKSFELLNSKGTQWGNNGYIWVSYESFGKLVKNAYVLVPEENY